jgi:hypothetical protein
MNAARAIPLTALRLAGTCNRCGRCCEERHEGEWYTCTSLELHGAMGAPDATTCRVYDARTDGMPITLLAPSGASRASSCWKDSLFETLGILNSGMGRGCSLTLEEGPA